MVKKLQLKQRNFLRFIKAVPDCLYPGAYPSGCYLAGGFIRTFFDNTEVKDFDLFFRESLDKDKALDYLLKNSSGRIIFSCPEGKLTTVRCGPWKIQLISERYYENPEELLNTFDITASQFCYHRGFLYCGDNSIRDAKKKHLRLNKVTFPAATFKRIAKYVGKGYTYDPKLVENFVVSTLAATGGIGPEDAKEWNNLWRFYID